MSIRFASHLYRNRHGTFYFRLVVPTDLRERVGQREFRFSLDTEQRQVAVLSSFPIIAALPKLLTEIRQMASDDHQTITGDYFKMWIAEKRQALNLQFRVEELEHQNAELQRELKMAVPRDRAQQAVKRAFSSGQVTGKNEMEDRLAFPRSPEKTPFYSELRDAWLKSLTANRIRGGVRKPPTPKTLEEYSNTTGFFIVVMEDMRIGNIDREIVGAYLDKLQKLPANISRKTVFKGKTIDEIIALGEPPQSARNVSKKIEHISSMFKWALEEKRRWGIDANPFIGYGLADNVQGKRRPFTLEELKRLLSTPDYLHRTFTSSYAYWMRPLAMFTGARLGELAQLDLKDFVEIEGIPCIDINDTDAIELQEIAGGGKKRVKNSNAKRLVPIHPELIAMGLLRHVERLRQQGEVHLFPELNRARRDGPGHAVSNWFQRIRERAGLHTKQETVFHSFRNLFITIILDRGVSPHMLAPIVGHEADLITGQVYWNKKDATKRLPTVEMFTLTDDLLKMLPRVEDVAFRPNGRAASRKSLAI